MRYAGLSGKLGGRRREGLENKNCLKTTEYFLRKAKIDNDTRIHIIAFFMANKITL